MTHTATETAALTTTQIAALEAAGAEIARGWIAHVDHCVLGACDYDFAAEGDWQLVRDVARDHGVDWDADDSQPPTEIRAEVWSAVERGYRAARESA